MDTQTKRYTKVQHQFKWLSAFLTTIMVKEVEKEVIMIILTIQEEDLQIKVVDVTGIQITQ